MKLTLIPATLVLVVTGCATTEPSAVTSAQAEQSTTAAYDRADEVALKAQNEADETSTKVAAEAAAKIETAQIDAEKTADAAYKVAEHVEAHGDTKLAAVQQAEFVETMHKELNERRAAVKALGKRGDIPAVKTAERAAAEVLAEAEKATPAVWTKHRQKVERAFARLDAAYGAARNAAQ